MSGLNWSPERHGGGAGALDDGTEASKLRIIEASYAPGESVSSVARRHGAAPNLLYRQRRLMTEGGGTAVGSAIG
jgi:transposase-like protein